MNEALYWNGVLLEATRRDHTLGHGRSADNAEVPLHGGPTRTSRAMAIVSLAIREAVAAAFTPASSYLLAKTSVAPPTVGISGVSNAIAGAAYTALTKLYEPRLESFLIEARDSALGVPPGANADYAAGVQIANALLDLRKDDRLDNGPYAPKHDRPAPRHQYDPFNRAQGHLSAAWGKLPRFGMPNHQPIADPPAPGTPDYQQDADQVLAFGGADSADRSQDQTEIGVFWGYDGANGLGVPPRMYNQIARQLAVAQSLSTQATAELFAELNVALADAGIDAWHYKYVYDFWRPVVGLNQPYGVRKWAPLGIPRTNDITEAALTPLTPNFPAYPSGHATFGAAAFQVLRMRLLGQTPISLIEVLAVQDAVDDGHLPSAVGPEMFEFVSDELDCHALGAGPKGAPRRYAPRAFQSYAHAIYENAASRLYLGVHWLFDGMPSSAASPPYGGVPLGLAIGEDTVGFFESLSTASVPAPAAAPAE